MSGIADPESVSFRLVQASRAHRAFAGALLADLDLYTGQEFMLATLADEKPLTQTQLAERCGLRAPTVTKMLKRMEAQGLVERRPHPQDSRVTQVFLTKKGERLRKAADNAWTALEERTVKDLTESEREELSRLLLKVRRNLRSDT